MPTVNHDTYDHTGIPGAGGYPEGTSFPASPTTNQKRYRTDLNLLFFYDGTRWLTTTLYHESFSPGNVLTPFAASSAVGRMAPWADTDLYLVSLFSSFMVGTTNDGTKYWTFALNKQTSADAAVAIVSHNTSARSPGTFYSVETAIGALFGPSTHKHLYVNATKTSTPGGVYAAFAVSYRLVGV